MNPYVLFAIALAGWGLWRVIRWFSSGGRVPLRGRRGTASGFSNSALAMQALYNPAAKNVIEFQAQEESRREDEDDGAPPKVGSD